MRARICIMCSVVVRVCVCVCVLPFFVFKKRGREMEGRKEGGKEGRG